MADDTTWIREYGKIPGTEITLYESRLPQPGVVFLAHHYIRPGRTRSRVTGRTNIVAGEGEEFTEQTEAEALRQRGEGVPAAPKRLPRVDGLGADPPKPRIVQGPSTMRTFDPSKDAPKDATPAERAAHQKAVLKYYETLEINATKARRDEGFSVIGWRLRALSPNSEIAIGGKNYGTQEKLSSLFRRIGQDQRTWLEGPEYMGRGDPYFFVSHKQHPRHSKDRFAFTPWVKSECIGWIIVEGSKLGLKFAVRALPEGVPPEKIAEARYLVQDVLDYRDGKFRCEVKPPREKSVRDASETLGIGGLEALSMSALKLFENYQSALRDSADKQDVHEAYHRILLHRFLRRRTLVPVGSRTSKIGEMAERRANLLQAHRVFVFDGNGCPTRLNTRFLQANGIDVYKLMLKRPTLTFMRNPRNEYLVNEWTKWLFEDVLGKDQADCRAIYSSESLTGLMALAGIGVLG